MSTFWVLLYAVFTLASGAVIAGLLRIDLRLEERVAIAVVTGIVAGIALTTALALPLGVTVGTVLGGALGPGAIAGAVALRGGDPRDPWRRSWTRAWGGWRRRTPWLMMALLVAGAAGLMAIFGHGIFERDGGISAGYSTVWSDWGHHHTRAASFALGGNLPPADPLFSGTALRYPFLPDVHTAMLDVLGLGPGLAYAAPGVVLSLAIAVLVVSLARRLGASAGAGVIAVVICLLGGGLGFVGLVGDACLHHGIGADRCSLAHVIGAPGDGVRVAVGTLHDIPGLVAAQPRAYDGLGHDRQPLPNLQWYTPLMAWWLPQTSIAYGFASVLVILVALLVALRSPPPQRLVFTMTGLLAGLLVLIHVHSLIALAIVLPLIALRHRRREWLWFAGAAAVASVPRLIQVALGPHGTAAAGNQFPWLEPGWMWDAAAGPARVEAGAGGIVRALGALLRLPFTPAYWQFWLLNVGIAVPLCLVVALAAAGRSGPARSRALAARLLRPFPPELVAFCLPFMVVFLAANVVVFQSWDWDNTKVLVYWYLAAALLAGTLITHWFRPCPPASPAPSPSTPPALEPGSTGREPSPSRWSRLWRPLAATATLATMLLTGVLTVLRLLPWTPSADATSGPYTIASPDDRRLGTEVAERTPRRAVFVTPGRPEDPVLTLAGRLSVLGYYGWLWSYGVDFGSRPDDVRAIYRGCAHAPAGCPVPGLLRHHGVSYVEVDDRLGDTGVLETGTDLDWWRSQRYPIVTSNQHIVIYDVRDR